MIVRNSFQQLVERKYLTIAPRVDEETEVVPATPQDIEILDLAEDALVVAVHRLAISATGYVVVWANIHIHPDRYRYVADLWPAAAALLDEIA